MFLYINIKLVNEQPKGKCFRSSNCKNKKNVALPVYHCQQKVKSIYDRPKNVREEEEKRSAKLFTIMFGVFIEKNTYLSSRVTEQVTKF